jgi:hypothetical protein
LRLTSNQTKVECPPSSVACRVQSGQLHRQLQKAKAEHLKLEQSSQVYSLLEFHMQVLHQYIEE